MANSYPDSFLKRRHKYVTVRTSAIYYEMGNIQGPVLSPCWLSLYQIKTLIYHGRIVWEHSVTDPNIYTVLNKENYDDFNLYPGNTSIEDPTVQPGTYYVGVEDDPNDPKIYQSDRLYVAILDNAGKTEIMEY